ncbi:Gfo/Idh/MocA family protein [Paenibacillus eucommiae]|uniref:Dehydrogenase n=1 Tax=Paenibacillus eucommiae TaxID=1355755 RepID=A0ABS4J3M3_9BACL|nr:Gfo/Idh/MocA family oxidoreductase [Paenibacillus eucommiae]MBP1993811.1 putative dehydrogenase [Paenibacillus eucommiae]
MIRVATIGYGFRIKGLLKLMQEQDPECRLVAITDVRNDQIKQELLAEGTDITAISFYDNVDEMLAGGTYDGIFVGTRCSLHTPFALKVLPTGIPLFLEKPVSTTMEDLNRLHDAYVQSQGKVVVSFPLRVTLHTKLVKEIIDSGKIGTIEHVQAINNVSYGSVYFHHWYRDESETHGLFLQKATHDFDYINHIVGVKPVRVCAMTSKQVFKGNKPAGLKCKDCDEQETCPESPQNLRRYAVEEPHGEYCSFAVDTGNEDSGSAIVEYETGMHLSYSQNFFIRKKASSRGARFMGYKGTVEFDWAVGDVKVFMHHTPRVETYQFDPSATAYGHAGGDSTLIENFIDIMKGKDVPSVAPMEAGILSVLTCLKARESAKTGTFQQISL